MMGVSAMQFVMENLPVTPKKIFPNVEKIQITDFGGVIFLVESLNGQQIARIASNSTMFGRI